MATAAVATAPCRMGRVVAACSSWTCCRSHRPDMNILRIGAGSAWWGDRIEPAALSATQRRSRLLVLRDDGGGDDLGGTGPRAPRSVVPGYDTYLDDRMQAVLPACMRRGTRIVTNQGWINPGRRGRAHRALASHARASRGDRRGGERRPHHRPRPRTHRHDPRDRAADGDARPDAHFSRGVPWRRADRRGAEGRRAGRRHGPRRRSFDFHRADDVRVRLGSTRPPTVGQGSGIGHLMECGAQVTGGYFSDPGFKDVPEPWNLGFPIAEVEADGSATLTKVAGTGGAVNLMTVKEQLLYEVHDPANYMTPDVVVDFTSVRLEEVARDRVRVRVSAASRARRRSRCRSAAPKDLSAKTCFSMPVRVPCAALSSPSGSWKSASRSSACRPRSCASTLSG